MEKVITGNQFLEVSEDLANDVVVFADWETYEDSVG